MVDLISISGLLLALFLVIMNGVFVATEFAFVRLRPTRVSTLVDREKPDTGLMQDAIENLDGYLAVSQLGITLSSLGFGWIDEPTVVVLIEPILDELLPARAIHLVAFTLGSGFITFLHVVFDEFVPKTFAIQGAERTASLVASFMKFFYYVFIPGTIVFNGTANYFTNLFGISPAAEGEETHSEEEILVTFIHFEEIGEIDLDEVEMIESVFELGDMIAHGIMVPCPNVETASASMTLSELRSVAASGTYARYIVLDEDGEQPTGFVHAEDILKTSKTETDHSDPITTHDIARDVLVVSEARWIDAILAEFQTHSGRQVTAVIDEWGVFKGIVTIEDVLEEIVGDIRGEFDTAPQSPTIEGRDDGTYAVDDGVPVREVSKRLGIEFEVDEVETIGGFVFSRLGREPEIADKIGRSGYVLRVDSIDDAGIERLVIQPLERSQKQTTEGD